MKFEVTIDHLIVDVYFCQISGILRNGYEMCEKYSWVD